jgi:hypothetical protein
MRNCNGCLVHPQEFSARLKALANLAGPLGRELQALALHALDLNQLTKLAKVIARRDRKANRLIR